MAFNDLETQKIKNAVDAIFMAKRPPVNIRHKVDFEYRIVNQSVELFEVRPHWQDNSQLLEHGIAKLTYVKSSQTWKLYWMRQDLKWHSYQPMAQSKQIEQLLEAVMQDEYGCFFG